MKIMQNASIKQRLTAIIMAASSIAVLLTTLTISIIGVYNLRLNMLQKLAVSSSIVGDRNTAALLFSDVALAEDTMRVFSVDNSILRACLYDQTGAVFSKYLNTHLPPTTPCPTNLEAREVVGKKTLEVMQPLVRGTDHIGNMYVESDMREIESYVQKQTSIATLVTVAALLVSYILAISLQRGISRPILSLADTAREISVNKDYSIRAAPFGDKGTSDSNEIVLLTDSFNSMLYEIGERDRQLKQQNVDLKDARDKAEAANRAKSQFLANISHELRTPLNAIIGFSSILMNQLFGTLGDPKYMEYSKDINESGMHLLDIINDILDLAKAEAGKLDLNYEEVHIGKAISKCMNIMSERAKKGNVTLINEVPKGMPPLVADRLRFIQILLNILSNAIKFTEDGGTVTISGGTREINGKLATFVFTVTDTGIGMTQADIEKAFQSFGQVDSGLNRKYEGTGLGLPLTRKLLELHNGYITLESEPGAGTVATICLPAISLDDVVKIET